MSDEKPVVYIFYGDDPHAIESEVKALRGRMGDPGIADMNTTTLDGRSATLNDLITAVGAMPFLAERRVVILTHPLARLAADKAKEAFIKLLNSVQPSSALVLMIEDTLQGKKGKEKHWLLNWAQQAGSRVYLKTCTLPHQNEMPAWIIKRTVELGGRINRDAAITLAEQVGNDTRFATQEIIKLLTYANYNRNIEKDDVLELTPFGLQTNVFEMVDKMSIGDAASASKSLYKLLEEENAQRLFGMVIRQFRLLIQARTLLDEGGSDNTLITELRLFSRVASNLKIQAKNFTITELETIYRHLFRLDKACKTGHLSYELALDTLIASLKKEKEAPQA